MVIEYLWLLKDANTAEQNKSKRKRKNELAITEEMVEGSNPAAVLVSSILSILEYQRDSFRSETVTDRRKAVYDLLAVFTIFFVTLILTVNFGLLQLYYPSIILWALCLIRRPEWKQNVPIF